MTTMQEIIMSAIAQYIETNQKLRMVNQSNTSNEGVIRCTTGTLNTVIAIYYDFQIDNATFRVSFNGADVRTIDDRNQFRIDYDKDPDTAFKQFISAIGKTLSN